MMKFSFLQDGWDGMGIKMNKHSLYEGWEV